MLRQGRGAPPVRSGEGARRLAAVRQVPALFDVRPCRVDTLPQHVEFVFQRIEPFPRVTVVRRPSRVRTGRHWRAGSASASTLPSLVWPGSEARGASGSGWRPAAPRLSRAPERRVAPVDGARRRHVAVFRLGCDALDVPPSAPAPDLVLLPMGPLPSVSLARWNAKRSNSAAAGRVPSWRPLDVKRRDPRWVAHYSRMGRQRLGHPYMAIGDTQCGPRRVGGMVCRPARVATERSCLSIEQAECQRKGCAAVPTVRRATCAECERCDGCGRRRSPRPARAAFSRRRRSFPGSRAAAAPGSAPCAAAPRTAGRR